MTTMPTQPVYRLPGDKQSNEIGIFAKGGGIIKTASTDNLDKDLGQYFKTLHVGTGGDLFYLTPDGQVDGWFGLPDGYTVAAVGSMVLSEGIFDGESVMTTCSKITWHGGE